MLSDPIQHMMDIFSSITNVRFSDCDPAGICHFSKLSIYFEETFLKAMRQEGFNWNKQTQDFSIPIVENKAEFFYQN